MKSLKETGLFTFHAITARDARLLNCTSLWLNKHFEGIFSSVELCNIYDPERYGKRTKTEVCKSLSISTFIDDRPDYHVVEESKLRLIVFGRPWNDSSIDWKQVGEIPSIRSLTDFISCNPPEIVVGVSGKLGSGKDTVSDIVIDNFPMFQKRAFATRVKQTVAALTNTSYEFGCTREGKRFRPKCFDASAEALTT